MPDRHAAIEIHCDSCGRWFAAPITVGNAWVLDKSAIIGAVVPCRFCKATVRCTSENVRERGGERSGRERIENVRATENPGGKGKGSPAPPAGRQS